MIEQLEKILKPNTIPMVLIKNGLVEKFHFCPNETTLVIATKNFYKVERCILPSTVVATEKGTIKTLFDDVLEEE